MSDQPPPLRDPFAIGDDERDARARRTPVPSGLAELPDPFAQRQKVVENTPAPVPATRAIRRPALSDTPVARKPFPLVPPAAMPEPQPLSVPPTPAATPAVDTSELATVAIPGFADLTGREMTMPATPAAGTAPASPRVFGAEPTMLTGREMTMPATPAEGSAPAALWLGAEPTMLTGREMTMPATPAEGTPATVNEADRAAIHTPRTMPGIPGMAPRMRPSSGKPATGIRNSTTATSDDAWHYQGRPGPFTGQEWGDWDIGGILGEGGMGAVYRAKQKSLNRRVALKVLAPNLAADLRLLQRFQLEARTASLLASPNVVQVFAAGEFEGNHFFVMEYVEGRDLYDVMKDRTAAGKPFTPDEAADIVIQAAKGLAEAGRIGVVHRDIKPPNLMVTNDGLVKVADFGIVKVMGEAVLTMTGQAVGTPSYVSPEQGRGESNIDQRSDLYSLGVVFYELLTGKKPFEGSTPNAIIYQHCYGEPKLPREINPLIDEKYQAVVLKCLQKKAEYRYQNAGELIRDLEDIRSGRMLASALANYRQGTGADEAKRESLSWAQRHLLALVAMIAVVLVAGGIGLYQVILYQQDKFARDEELRREADRLEQLLVELDTPRAIPPQAKKLLADYAKLPFIKTERLKIWQAKLSQVDKLRADLVVLNGSTITLPERLKAKADLLDYQKQVGTGDAQAEEWRDRLDFFDKREQDLRRALQNVDQQSNLTMAVVAGAKGNLAELRTMVREDDPLVKRVTARLKDFDERYQRLIANLSQLDQSGTLITDTLRTRLQADLVELTSMIGSQDDNIAKWTVKLTSNATRITQLRERLRRLDQFELPPVAVQLELDKDFAALKELVDDNDPEMQAWKAKVAATTAEIASLRKRLGRLDQPNLLAVSEIVPQARLLDTLRELVGEGDEQLLAWQKKHQATVARHGELRTALTRLERPEPLTLDEQRLLADAREMFAGLGGLSAEQDALYQRRLNDERIQTEARVERLKSLDHAEPLSAALRQDLLIYAQQAGEENADVVRWNAKRARIDDVLGLLTPLDSAAPLPEAVEVLLTRLATEVGDGDAQVRRWRAKVARVATVAAALAPLDRAASLPADVHAALADFVSLVGEGDQRYRQWRSKTERVATLVQALTQSLAAYGHSPTAHAQLHADYRELTALVSPEDPQVAAWAARLTHLDGPAKPSWAGASGRDDFGLWADLVVAPELLQRFRFVPAGSFIIGSPDQEAGHEVDETQVRVTITAAFWLADSECTQAMWRQITGSDPARHRADDRPVERVSWNDANDFISKARERLAVPLRLPSEAEWEYAARAGATGSISTSRTDATALGTVAWYDANSGSASKAVKLRFANPIGLYDLHGNVWEWCQDRYAPYTTVPVNDPLGRDGLLSVVRGGSWGDPAGTCRLANRAALRPDVRSAYVGLRLAATVEWEKGVPAPATATVPPVAEIPATAPTALTPLLPPTADAPAAPSTPSEVPAQVAPLTDVAPTVPVEPGVQP